MSSIFNFSTDKLLAVEITEFGKIRPIAKLRGPGKKSSLVELDSTKDLTPAAMVFPVAMSLTGSDDDHVKMISIESDNWAPHYPICETYFLKPLWPFDATDLPYRGPNSAANRLPEDNTMTFILNSDLNLIWNNSPSSPRELHLGVRSLAAAFFLTLRLRKSSSGTLLITDGAGKKTEYKV